MQAQRAQLTKAFKQFDADGSGFLNKAELRNLMCNMVSLRAVRTLDRYSPVPK